MAASPFLPISSHSPASGPLHEPRPLPAARSPRPPRSPLAPRAPRRRAEPGMPAAFYGVWLNGPARGVVVRMQRGRTCDPSAPVPAAQQVLNRFHLALSRQREAKSVLSREGSCHSLKGTSLRKGREVDQDRASAGRRARPGGAQADPRQLPGGGILCFWPQSQAVPERGSTCGVGRRGWGADEQGSDHHALPGPLPPRLLAALGAELGEGRVWALCLMIPRSSPWSCRCVCQTVGEQKGVVPRPRNSVQLLVKVAAGLGVPLPPCRAATEQQSGEK